MVQTVEVVEVEMAAPDMPVGELLLEYQLVGYRVCSTDNMQSAVYIR